MVASHPGKASAWYRRQPSRQPRYPGAASPAGWFQPTGGEAAPPFRPGMEPARSDDIAGPSGRLPAAFEGDVGDYGDPRPAAVHPSHCPWPGRSPAAPGRRPVVGPTEALRGRAGGPGLTVPAGAIPGLLGLERRSGWQLAQEVWAQAGVRWEPASTASTASTADADSGQVGTAPAHAPDALAREWNDPTQEWQRPADDWSAAAEDSSGGPAQDLERPAGDWGAPPPDWSDDHVREWERPAGDWHDPADDWERPAEDWGGAVQDPEWPADDWYAADQGPEHPAGDWDNAEQDQERPAQDWHESAQDWHDPAQGWGGTPEDWADPAEGWDQSPDAHGETADRWPGPAAGWGAPVRDPDELAEDWSVPTAGLAESAVGPAAPGQPAPGTRRGGFPARDYPGQSWARGASGQVPIPPPAFAAMPLSAPVTAERPASRPADDPDALFRAWQGSVRQAAGPRGHWTGGRGGRKTRRRAWQATAIGVPAAVIVIVGAGALMMLTGKADRMLAIGTTSSGPGAGESHVTAIALAGYPGQHGSVAADSVWSAAGATLAVGDADGHPAIWRRAEGAGPWVLASAAIVGATSGNGTLTAVTHGPAGWIAVGLATRNGQAYPLAFGSADGVSWQPVTSLSSVAGPGVEFLGVAAGPDGYAVVGRQLAGGRVFASLWWSADMRLWVSGANGGLDGRLTASTANAVAATATGFVAVGSHGALGAIWTTHDGAHWGLRDLAAPSGARDATLRQVTVRGNTIVATGYAVTGAGDVPLAVASADDGARWQPVTLPVPRGLGQVTALTAAGGTLLAAGLAEDGRGRGAGPGHFVTWTSPDGLHWSAASTVAGIGQLSALSATGGTITGTGTITSTGRGAAQRGAHPSLVTFPAP
jgi:hypothetical protein